MITGKEDLIQALIEAYLMEKGTMNFYADAAVKALNPEAKKVFRNLSLWEHKHMDFIGYLYQSIQEDRDITGFDRFSKNTEAPHTEAGIPVKDLEAEIEKHKFIDDPGALILALEIEGKSYSLYSKLAKSAVDTNARVVFQEMSEQETKHIDYLKRLRIKLGET